MPSMPGRSMSLIHRTTVSSTTIAVIAGPSTPLRKISTVTTTPTTAPMSQPAPVVRRRRGSGGGAPDGRRLGARRPGRPGALPSTAAPDVDGPMSGTTTSLTRAPPWEGRWARS
jgi:hypothetical protein